MDSNQFSIEMAGLTIEINTPSPQARYLCRDYLSDGEPDIRIDVTPEDVEREFAGKKDSLTGNQENKPLIIQENGRRTFIRRIDESYLETIAAYRKIAEKVIDLNIFLMHGAVIAVRDRAFMFTAASGTGKTTHIRQWLENCGDAFVVNGDKPLIRITDTEAIACGTPWCGKEHLGTNSMVPLKGIVFMERAEENQMEEISFVQAYPSLLQQTYIPEEPEKAKKSLNLLSRLPGKVSFWRFRCNNFRDDCFQIAYNALMGK